MLIVINLVGDDEAVIEKDSLTAEAKCLEDERLKQAAWLEWLERAPQPQVIPVES
jgi:hypothetical protein